MARAVRRHRRQPEALQRRGPDSACGNCRRSAGRRRPDAADGQAARRPAPGTRARARHPCAGSERATRAASRAAAATSEFARTPAAVLVNSDSEPSRNWMRRMRMTFASKSTSSHSRPELLGRPRAHQERRRRRRRPCRGRRARRREDARPRRASARPCAPSRAALEAGRHGGRAELVILGGERQRGLEGHQRLVGRIDRDLVRDELMPGADLARRQLLDLDAAEELDRARLGLRADARSNDRSPRLARRRGPTT